MTLPTGYRMPSSSSRSSAAPPCGLAIEKQVKKAKGSRATENEIYEAVAGTGHGNHLRLTAKRSVVAARSEG